MNQELKEFLIGLFVLICLVALFCIILNYAIDERDSYEEEKCLEFCNPSSYYFDAGKFGSSTCVCDASKSGG